MSTEHSEVAKPESATKGLSSARRSAGQHVFLCGTTVTRLEDFVRGLKDTNVPDKHMVAAGFGFLEDATVALEKLREAVARCHDMMEISPEDSLLEKYFLELSDLHGKFTICKASLSESFAALALVAAASAAPMADNPAPYQPEPAYAPAPYQPEPAYAPAPYQAEPAYAPAPYKPAYKPASYQEPSYEEPAKYEYAYAVADDYAQTNFAQNEARDGYATNGGYRVNLPDGRTQIVTYTVQDDASGYVADVRYEGEAQYPKYEPKAAYQPAPQYAPAPKYAPAPAYNPAPAYEPTPAYEPAPAYEA
eukprot:snap_masked-scaffold205_size259573-processed-gene-1.11 protein:Tk01387 transcript:snap_masked-scaffold205_size259573-processed-gene-1.11-mRNA-1 annotation:"cuticle protein"